MIASEERGPFPTSFESKRGILSLPKGDLPLCPRPWVSRGECRDRSHEMWRKAQLRFHLLDLTSGGKHPTFIPSA
ncbi:hypothetical protein Mapa_004998 [Marchantia paleacea]|nr:hypothetical protein Mapa_004998 [Marchantia paleacea]